MDTGEKMPMSSFKSTSVQRAKALNQHVPGAGAYTPEYSAIEKNALNPANGMRAKGPRFKVSDTWERAQAKEALTEANEAAIEAEREEREASLGNVDVARAAADEDPTAVKEEALRRAERRDRELALRQAGDAAERRRAELDEQLEDPDADPASVARAERDLAQAEARQQQDKAVTTTASSYTIVLRAPANAVRPRSRPSEPLRAAGGG